MRRVTNTKPLRSTFLQGKVPSANAKPQFMSSRRSAFNEVNDWVLRAHLLLHYFSIVSSLCGASKTNTVKWLFIDSWDKQVAAVGRRPAGSVGEFHSTSCQKTLSHIFEHRTNQTIDSCSKTELQTMFFSSLDTLQKFVMYKTLYPAYWMYFLGGKI